MHMKMVIKIWICLLLVPELGATVSADNIVVSLLKLIERKATFDPDNTHEKDSLEFARLSDGIVDLFGTFAEWRPWNEICLDGHSSLIPSGRYCIDEYEFSSVTRGLYEVYAHAKQHQNGMRFINLTTLAALSNRMDSFRKTDYLLAWKCITSMVPVIDSPQYEIIVGNLLNSTYSDYSLFHILEHIFANPHRFSSNFAVANSDLVLMAWHPFQNVSGVAFYEDFNRTDPHWISPIYNGQSSRNVDLANLKIAGYIPRKFLRKQFAHDQEQVIVMLIVTNGAKYNWILNLRDGIDNYIGIGMPGQCKKNRVPLLKAFFRTERSDRENVWTEFGRKYFDSLQNNNWYTCALSKMSYFGGAKFKGAKKKESCFTNRTQPNIMGSFLYSFTNKQIPPYEQMETEIQRFVKIESQTEFKQQISYFVWSKYESYEQWASDRSSAYWIKWPKYDVCFLNAIHKEFYRFRGSHFETAKEEYCMERIEDSGLKWRQTPVYTEIFPEHLCLDRNLNLPSKFCYENGVLADSTTLGAHKECSDEHPTSAGTEYLYQLLIRCRNKDDECGNSVSSVRDNISSYVDVALYLDYFIDANLLDADTFFQLFDIALPMVEAQAKHKPQLTYLSSLMFSFLNSRGALLSSFGFEDGFAYWKLTRDTAVELPYLIPELDFGIVFAGVAFYEAQAKKLKSYSNLKDVRVIFYVNCESYRNCTEMVNSVDAFLIFNSNFTNDDRYSTRSTILAFMNRGPTYDNFNLTVFLKTMESAVDDREGSWFTIELTCGELTVVSITRPVDDACDTTSKLSIFRMFFARGNGSRVTVEDGETMADLLSELVILSHTELRDLNREDSPTLQVITFGASVLSVIGLASVATSMVTVTDWCRKRFHVGQLGLALACQNFFFLVDAKHFNYIAYVFFYYLLLAQTAWLMIVGCVRYTRFVKIFGNFQFSTLKALACGWLVPLVATFGMVLVNLGCVRCNMCSKNEHAFTFVVLMPILVVLVSGLILYGVVVFKLVSPQLELRSETKKIRIRAAIMLPYVLVALAILLFVILAPTLWVSTFEYYLLRTIIPSQGLLLSIILVVVDNGLHKLDAVIDPTVEISD